MITPIPLEDYVLLLFSSFVPLRLRGSLQYKFFRREGSKRKVGIAYQNAGT
jgi:hypothetical protein